MITIHNITSIPLRKRQFVGLIVQPNRLYNYTTFSAIMQEQKIFRRDYQDTLYRKIPAKSIINVTEISIENCITTDNFGQGSNLRKPLYNCGFNLLALNFVNKIFAQKLVQKISAQVEFVTYNCLVVHIFSSVIKCANFNSVLTELKFAHFFKTE